MSVSKEKLQELAQGWENDAAVTKTMVPELSSLDPFTQMGLLSQAQRICAQELRKVVEESEDE